MSYISTIIIVEQENALIPHGVHTLGYGAECFDIMSEQTASMAVFRWVPKGNSVDVLRGLHTLCSKDGFIF